MLFDQNQFQDFVSLGPGFLKQAGCFSPPGGGRRAEASPVATKTRRCAGPAGRFLERQKRDESRKHENSGRRQKLLKAGDPASREERRASRGQQKLSTGRKTTIKEENQQSAGRSLQENFQATARVAQGPQFVCSDPNHEESSRQKSLIFS